MKPRTAFGQRTLSGEYFTSEEIFLAERERIFHRSWILAGHVSQLASPGSYLPLRAGPRERRWSYATAREVRAFHNLCRHRGSRLCQEAAGRGGARDSVSLPRLDLRAGRRAAGGAQHGWDSRLRSAGAWAQAGRARRLQGLLFLNLAPDPVPFAEALPGLQGKFGSWRLSELQSVRQIVYDVEANWKLFFHNFSECYHCPTVHPHLEQADAVPQLRERPRRRAGPGRADVDEQSRGEHDDGRRALRRPLRRPLPRGARARLLLHGLPERLPVLPSRLRAGPPRVALGLGRTRIVCDWYFHPDAIAAPGFDPQPAIDFWDLTNRQDWELCANAYKGVSSNAWEPGPYSELESQLAAFDRQYLRALAGAGPALRAVGASG